MKSVTAASYMSIDFYALSFVVIGSRLNGLFSRFGANRYGEQTTDEFIILLASFNMLNHIDD